jgi:replicative DNA helicase
MPPDRGHRDTMVSTGFPELDAGEGVLHRGKLSVLAGAPSTGKSALAMAMMLGACAPAEAAAVCFTSFYENGDLLLRLLASTGGVAPARSSQRRHGILAFREQLLRRGLHLHQAGGIVRPCDVVAEQARAVARQSPGLNALVIDPLLTSTPGMRAGSAERRATVVGLQELAAELDIAVLAVVALEGDGGEARPDRTRLGALGFEDGLVDTELLLHRPAAFTRRAPPGLAEVAIHRASDPEPRLATLRYLPDEGRFASQPGG